MDKFLHTKKFLWPVLLLLVSACSFQPTPEQLNVTPLNKFSLDNMDEIRPYHEQ